jgi:hypothetical protein
MHVDCLGSRTMRTDARAESVAGDVANDARGNVLTVRGRTWEFSRGEEALRRLQKPLGCRPEIGIPAEKLT